MQATLLSLPTELRLQIAEYSLEQEPDSGLSLPGEDEYVPKLGCSDPSNLSLLLVCRQFRDDFTDIAYQKTRFVLGCSAKAVIEEQSDDKLKHIRMLAINCTHDSVFTWLKTGLLFNKDCLHLDELCFIMSRSDDFDQSEMVKLLRCLRNVGTIRFVVSHKTNSADRKGWARLIGRMLKDDHYHRYDAPNAPDLGSTWWDWKLSELDRGLTLTAREPKPPMDEEEYISFVAPHIHRLMAMVAA